MIRIPDTPGLQPTRVNAPDARMAAANAPNAALGGPIAEAIAGVGSAFQAVADKAQKMENARAESEARMQLDSAYSALQIDLEKDPDPVSRINRTQEFFESNRGMVENPNYSPQVRDSLRQHYTEFASRGTVSAAAGAAKLAQQRAGLALNNELDAAIRNNDGAAGLGVIERAVAQGVLLPEQGDAARAKLDDTLHRQREQRSAVEDPAQWLQENPPNKPAAGYDPVQWEQLQDFARGQLRQRTYDATGKIQDGMASGAITKPEQIDKLAADLRPSVVEELKNNLLIRSSEGYKEKIASPEFQAQTYGKISSAIASFDPDDKDADLRLAQIDGAMRNLKPGFLRDKVQKQYDAHGKSGELPESKTYGEFALKQVDELYKAGRFGKEAKPAKLRTADLVKGFLKDSEKLQRLGFSSDQADKIIETAQDPALGQKAFIEAWKDRPGGSVNASEIELATANALRHGQATIDWNDPDSEMVATDSNLETFRKYGIAKMKLEEFLRLTPDAKTPEIDAEFLKVTGEGIRAEAKEKFTAPKPVRGGINDLPATSSNRNYSVGPGNVVTAETEIAVQANAKGYLKNPNMDLTKAPLGMRNNNPTNIVYPSEKVARRFGAIGKSTNQDAGSKTPQGGKYSQMVFANPEDGMKAGARLARSKYNGGMTTATELITASNGWTPGNHEAARNIAKGMGLGPNDDLNLDDPVFMSRFLKALVIQEHGKAGAMYKDSLFTRAAQSVS